MISANQKGLFVLLGLMVAFSFSVDAAQVQIMKSSSAQSQDDPVGADPSANDGEESDDDDSTGDQSPVYKVESIKTPKSERDLLTSKKENVRLELVGNLRKQSHLKQQIEHLTNESQSDQEIEDAEKLVANETESAEMADMLGDMWKEQRMFGVPAYEKHVEHELHELKEEEEDLEAKLKGKHVEPKLKGEHGEDDDEEKEKDDEEDEKQTQNKSVKVGNEWKAPTVNFWRMSHASQKTIFISSLVYLVGGVLAAVLFKQMRAKYFVLEDSLDGHPNKRGFSFPIFGCLGADLKLCAMGFCCPCLAWANTVERRLKVSYWQAFVAFFGLLMLDTYTMGLSVIALAILGAFYRQKLRESYDIDRFESGSKTTAAMDFVLWLFCQPCVIIQEAREETANHAPEPRSYSKEAA